MKSLAKCIIEKFISRHTSDDDKTGFSEWDKGLPEYVYETIFGYLRANELRNCRTVCRNWESWVTPLMVNKTRVVFDGDSGTKCALILKPRVLWSTGVTKRLVFYLNNSSPGFLQWTEMKIKNVSPTDIRKVLMELPYETKKSSFQSITALELSNCTIEWTSMIRFVSAFECLTKLSDMKTIYLFDNCRQMCTNFRILQERLLSKLVSTRFPFTSLKIQRKDVDFTTSILLKVFDSTCKNLNEFELTLCSCDTWVSTSDRVDFVVNLGLFLGNHATNIKRLCFDWTSSKYNLFFEDFLRFLTIFRMGIENVELLLTEIILNFEWVFLSSPEIQNTFIPFIHGLPNLKCLKLGKIVLEQEFGHVLDQLRSVHRNECVFDFSLMVTDQPAFNFPRTNIAVMERSPAIRNCMSALRVAISCESTEDIQQVLPFRENLLFLNTFELLIYHIWSAKSEFSNFAINKIVYSFPNLTTLCLMDGSKFFYRKRFRITNQYEKMSRASFGNQNMQLILKNLTKLKNLRLRLRMSYLNDRGTTGLTSVSCCRILTSSDFKAVAPKEDIVGFSFSNLKDIEEIILKGLGEGITDVTAFYGFNDLPKLKNLTMFGDTQVTNRGKRVLYEKFPKTRGCDVQLT